MSKLVTLIIETEQTTHDETIVANEGWWKFRLVTLTEPLDENDPIDDRVEAEVQTVFLTSTTWVIELEDDRYACYGQRVADDKLLVLGAQQVVEFVIDTTTQDLSTAKDINESISPLVMDNAEEFNDSGDTSFPG